MLKTADARRCIVERTRLLLGPRDEIFHRSDRRCRIDHEHVRPRREYRDRSERFDRIIFGGVESRIARVRDRYDAVRVPIGCGVRATLGAVRPAGTAAVVDIDLLSEFYAELLRDQPAYHV